MRFAINQTERGVTHRIGVVTAENASSAIIKALRLWPPQVRRDFTAPMLSTETLRTN